jgi:hypothetical protein
MIVRFQADADLNEDIVSGVLRRVPEILRPRTKLDLKAYRTIRFS